MKSINKRNPSLPSKADIQRIKDESIAMARAKTPAGKRDERTAREKLLYCGGASTTLKRSIILLRRKTIALEIQLLQENIEAWRKKINIMLADDKTKPVTVYERSQLFAAIQSAQSKIKSRTKAFDALPTPAQVNKDLAIL